ncbi:HAD-like domain-containing protein [Cercophora newfieldiana]|uniref:HAD-like domain-containing protein n=1 Tax=Cercophora newfieldiana TaxID=92897 RepID=A0AA39YBY5_9PEZI|nr:HAD-like domain-containing protein [Cercophora newfieldiana]
MASSKAVIAFDLYGTLLSTESIAAELAKLFGDDNAKSLAASWRRYQLEYTWRINSMGLYRTFSEITRAALHHAVAEAGLSLGNEDADKLMDAYNGLNVFPDVPEALKTVEQTPDVEALIFSNGTDEMVSASVKTSPQLQPYAGLFKGLVTVDGLKVFKPDRRTYEHLVQEVGKQDALEAVWLVTANPFDVVGASAAGLMTAWIDRAGKGWVDMLGDVIGGIEPTLVAPGVDKAIEAIVGSLG